MMAEGKGIKEELGKNGARNMGREYDKKGNRGDGKI